MIFWGFPLFFSGVHLIKKKRKKERKKERKSKHLFYNDHVYSYFFKNNATFLQFSGVSIAVLSSNGKRIEKATILFWQSGIGVNVTGNGQMLSVAAILPPQLKVLNTYCLHYFSLLFVPLCPR